MRPDAFDPVGEANRLLAEELRADAEKRKRMPLEVADVPAINPRKRREELIEKVLSGRWISLDEALARRQPKPDPHPFRETAGDL